MSSGPTSERAGQAVAPAEEISPYASSADRETLVAAFGDVKRSGTWLPPEELRAIAGFANISLDLTVAELPAGITEVNALAVFGNVVIRVPATLEVELEGISIFGKLEQRSARGEGAKGKVRRWLGMREGSDPASADAEPPADEEAFLSVRGTAIFGNVILEIA